MRRAAARNDVGFSDTSDKATVLGEACLDVTLLLALVGLAATTRMACLRRALRSRSKTYRVSETTHFSQSLLHLQTRADEEARTEGPGKIQTKENQKPLKPSTNQPKNTKQHAVSTKISGTRGRQLTLN